MPFFSVIIPLFNKEDYIESTLNSVLNQSYNDFEIIVVDDGSNDNSAYLVSQFKDSRIKLIKQKNKGVSVARNTGIEYAKANYIALLDADDLWYENHLFELKKQIDLFPNAGLYCNNYKVYHNENFQQNARLNFEYFENCLIVEDYFKASIINSVAWTSAVAFSKETFNIIGGFNPDYKTTQDIDLWVRIALKYEVSFNPKITMAYKFYVDNSLSKNENEYNIIRYNFLQSYIEEEKLNSSLKLYLDKNRYALAIRSLRNNNNILYSKLKKEINYKNLNNKQRLLLKCPSFMLIILKRIQSFLLERGIYLTAFK